MYSLLTWLLRLLGPRWQLDANTADFLERLPRLGKGVSVPTQLLPIGARLWLRGRFNKEFLDTHRDWVLPFWAVRELDPADSGFLPRGLEPVLLNHSYRNWTAVGHPGHTLEAIVDPRGLVTPQPGGAAWSLDTWVEVNGELFFPSRLAEQLIQQGLYENLPLMQTRYEPARVRVNQQVFAVTDDEDRDWVIASVSVENPRAEPRRATVYLSARPFNPEGIALVKNAEWRMRPDGVTELYINDLLAAYLPRPDRVSTGDESRGDVALQLDARDGPTSITSEVGVASALAAYPLELAPHTSQTITAVLPMDEKAEGSDLAAGWTAPTAFPALRRAATERWRELLARGMTLRLPDERVQDAFHASKAHLLVLHDGDSITPGPFLYHTFWFRDAAYMLHALDQLGYHEEVHQVLAHYPTRLLKNGYYLSQEGEWDSNGQALWSQADHARLSGDFELLSKQYWTMLNAAHWIDAERQKTKRAGTRVPEHGLLPAGSSAEHLGPSDFYYWDDFWGLAGLRAAAYAARIMGQSGDEQKLLAAYDALRRDVDASLKAASSRTGAQWMPASPYRNADSAMVANLVALYPLQLMPANDPRIRATLDELVRTSWFEDTLFHYVGHSALGTYLAMHVAGCLVFQRNVDAWKIINWLLNHASPTWAWPEGIHPRTRRGGHGDGLHGWAAADFVSLIRNTILFEEDDHLVLTPVLPQDWTFETFSIRVERAATYFGTVDLTIAFGDRNATLVIKGAWREPPAYLEWNLPQTLKTAGGDKPGVELMDAHRVRIPGNVSRVVAMW